MKVLRITTEVNGRRVQAATAFGHSFVLSLHGIGPLQECDLTFEFDWEHSPRYGLLFELLPRKKEQKVLLNAR